MQKQAPSAGRILVAVGFALSCFALLLFLWVTFGGPVPFKPESYKISADFPEAITLSEEADVRVGGVTVGSVDKLELPEEGNATRAVMEIDPEFAPISSDAKAILRMKTLLGETYVELTTGTQVDPDEDNQLEESEDESAQEGSTDVSGLSGDDAIEPLEEGGHLADSQVVEQVQIDEIFNALDQETRQAFQLWMRNAGIAVEGRGLDLNDAFGNIGPFSQDASDVLATLREQEEALRGVVRNTGAVFEALTARDEALTGAIVGSQRTLRGLASRDEALAETFQVLPTFQVESRKTLARLERFARNAGPLFRDLRPVARDLSPTLRDLRRLSPPLRRLFGNLDPLITASETGLPALGRFLGELRPVMENLDPFLANLSPIIRYLDFYAPVVTDFLGNIAAGTSGALPPAANQTQPRHISRQMSTLTAPQVESLGIWRDRLSTNRGNAYLLPFALGNPRSAQAGEVFPSFDCQNTGAAGGINTGENAGEGMVTPPRDVYGEGYPPSNPRASEGVYPLSVAASNANLADVFGLLPPPLGDIFSALPGELGDLRPLAQFGAFAPCLTQEFAMGNFPEEFGGGRLPQVLADP